MYHNFEHIPALIHKEKYLFDTPVYIDHFIYDKIISDGTAKNFSCLHQHQFIEVSYVEKGNGFHQIWNETTAIMPGSLFVLNVAVPHCFFSDSPEEPLIVRSLFFDYQDLFEGEIVEIGNDSYLFGLFSQNNFDVSLSLKSKYLKLISQKFDEIELEIEEKKLDWQNVLHLQVSLLLYQIKRLSAASSTPQTLAQKGTLDNTMLVSEVLQLIRKHYTDPLFSMETISEMMHISSASISRSFYKVTGKYFSDYLCFYRMHQALLQLTETELSNEEISYLCGYRDSHSFYKHFRQYTGTTPKGFRKQKDMYSLLLQNEAREFKQVLCTEISEKLQQGKQNDTVILVSQALDEGMPPETILHEGLLNGMNKLGEKFQTNEVFVPEVLQASSTMNVCMDLLKPRLFEPALPVLGTAVICTVKGDIHDIGKNLVKLMLETEGIHCIDLGVDVAPSMVVDAVREHHAELLCLSALLTTTMWAQKETIDALTTAGLREQVKVMVGGAPVTQEFADSIGADCYTPDAITAAREAKRFLTERKQRSV